MQEKSSGKTNPFLFKFNKKSYSKIIEFLKSTKLYFIDS